MGKAVVCGGSIGGLFAAAALMKGGWEVDVYERADRELSARGAGIVTHAELIDALLSVDAQTTDLGVSVEERVAFGLDGTAVRRIAHPQVVTSWDRVHRLLRGLVPDDRYHLGKSVSGYRDDEGGVTVRFDDGTDAEADILIGADGFRSAVRACMLPDVQPEYAGYVVWRTLADEADLPGDVRREVFPAFGLFLPSGSQVIGYPIAGPSNDLRSGHRRYNFVWYVPVADADLHDMLTDDGGVHHPLSIAPPLVRDSVVEAMRLEAERRLPEPFLQILAVSQRPFFTPIYDHHSPVMAAGRVALAGDAACVARPHVGMGVTKAAEDALSLARHLRGLNTIAALSSYSDERVPAARDAFDRSRRLGSHIFDKPEGGENRDGRSHPRQDTILRETAVVRV